MTTTALRQTGWRFQTAHDHVPATLRTKVRECLRAWSLPEAIVYDTLVAVSEVATNAVLHGAAPLRAILRTTSLDGHDALEFRLYDAQTLLTTSQQDRQDFGRGLAVIQATTDCFGVTTESEGKTIWFIKRTD